MKKRFLLVMTSFFILISGCSGAKPINLMENIQREDLNIQTEYTDETRRLITEFGVNVFKNSYEDENLLLSPVSILFALGMTTNGADGNTLAQMEDVFGLTIQEMNEILYKYAQGLPQGEFYKTKIANSIWFKESDSLNINKEFLQTNANYYEAQLYESVFDQSVVKSINQWVNDNTDGMIREILDEMPTSAVMFLINALVFDAQWSSIYEKHQVRDGIFTKEDGTEIDSEFMYSAEYNYLEDELFTGVMKYYKERKYAFVGLLPKNNSFIEEAIHNLTADQITNLLDNVSHIEVRTAIPKFETETSAQLNQILSDLGMSDVFDPQRANLSKIGSSGNGNLFIDQVLHKTFISVHEKGTKAGAVTMVSVNESAMGVSEYKTVYLNRPFIYMIIDCETNSPLFIGVMKDIDSK